MGQGTAGGTNKSIGCLGWVRSIARGVERGRGESKVKNETEKLKGVRGRGEGHNLNADYNRRPNSKQQTTNKQMLLPRPHAAHIRLHFANTNTNAHLLRRVSAGGREGEGRVGIEPPLSR